MDDTLLELRLKKLKSKAIRAELYLFALLVGVVYFLETTGRFNISGFSTVCTPELSWLGMGEKDQLTVNETLTGICNMNRAFKIGTILLFPYMVLCALMVASRLKTTPALWWQGLYLERQEDGGQPHLAEAIRLFVFSRIFLPFWFQAFYFMFFDFSLSLHQLFMVLVYFFALDSGLTLIEAARKSPFVWDETVSGLKFALTPKKKQKIEEAVENTSRRWFFKVALWSIKVEKFYRAIPFFIFGFLAFNALNEGSSPEDYNAFLYKRAPVEWGGNNGYFALAGLSAPEKTENSYEYGRQTAAFHSRPFVDWMHQARISFIGDVPQNIPSTLYKPDDKERLPEFSDKEKHLVCSAKMKAPDDSFSCLDRGAMMTLVDVNKTLWARYQRLPDYAVFSKPDIPISDDPYKGQDMIDLTRLKVSEILLLQQEGKTPEALEEWARYMRFYLKTIGTPQTLVERAIFLTLVRSHYSVLERLLYNDPSVATAYRDVLQDILGGVNSENFRLKTLISDEWRAMAPFLESMIGFMPFQQWQIYYCLQESEALSSLPAKEVFLRLERDGICEKFYPRDTDTMLLKSLTDPGEPFGNLFYGAMIPGILKGQQLSMAVHYLLADLRMALTGAQILREGIPPENVEAYLKTAPPNPLTGTPFLWDGVNKRLYYKNMESKQADLESNHTFHLNFGGKKKAP